MFSVLKKFFIIIDLQCSVHFCSTAESCMYIPLSPSCSIQRDWIQLPVLYSTACPFLFILNVVITSLTVKCDPCLEIPVSVACFCFLSALLRLICHCSTQILHPLTRNYGKPWLTNSKVSTPCKPAECSDLPMSSPEVP